MGTGMAMATTAPATRTLRTTLTVPPEAMTKNEAVALVQDTTGRRMKVQQMPRPVARLAMRLLNKRNNALASAFGAGLLQDIRPADWDDEPLRQRGIKPTPASDFLREQARR